MATRSSFLLILTFLITGLLRSTAQSTLPVISWQKSLGGSRQENFYQMLKTPDGGSVILGNTSSNDGDVSGNHLQFDGNPSVDFWVVKVSDSGILEWQKCIGGSMHEQTTANIMLTPDGGVLLYGYITSSDGDAVGYHGSEDGFVAKLSGTGTLLWSKCLGGTSIDHFNEAVVTPSGNYLLGGYTYSNNGDVSGNHGTGSDIWLVELTPSGTMVWQKCFGGSGNETLADIEPLDNSGYLFCGATTSSNGDVSGFNAATDAWLVSTDLSGNINWQKCYYDASSTYDNDYGQKITATAGAYLFTYTNLRTPPVFYSYNNYVIHYQYCGKINMGNGSLSELTYLNPTTLAYVPSESSWFPPKRIKPKQGGGLLVVNDLRSCVTRDEYMLGFPPYTPAAQNMTYSKTLNTSGLHNVGQLQLPVQCPTGVELSSLVTYGGNRPADMASLHENLVIHAGMSDAQNRPAAQQLGNNDAMLNIGSSNTYWGGSDNDEFKEVSILDPHSFYAAGTTRSTSGHVTGNHGQVDIWLVRFSFRNSNIKGVVFNDLNGNGIKDAGEDLINNQAVKSVKPGVQIITYTQNGSFDHLVDTGNYVTQIVNNYPYIALTPAQKNSNVNTYNITDSFGLGMRMLPGVKDLQVSLLAMNPARPGFDITYHLLYKNLGTDTTAGTQVSFIKDARTTLVSSSLPGYIQNGDTLLWNTGALQPGYQHTISVVLHVAAPPVVQINDTLSCQAIINPVANDITPADNSIISRLVVRGSYDPNDKTNLHGGEVGKNYLVSGGYLYYRIRFQNTGTDTAFTVKINDTLDAGLDVNTLEVLEASHNYSLRISNRAASWLFNNILLPDSFTNSAASNGYIFFRIKPLATAISPSRVFSNRASIYFDYNESVNTNTDQVRIRTARKPLITGIAPAYCKSTTGIITGKVSNPLPGYTVNVWIDNTPVAYQPADSSFTLNLLSIAPGNHLLKVKFSEFDLVEDSTMQNLSIDSLFIPRILTPDTSICGITVFNIRTDVPVNQWLNANVTISGTNNFAQTLNLAPVNNIIAIKNNGLCPQGRDTIVVNINFLTIPYIYNRDTTVCIVSAPFDLFANYPVTWVGAGMSGSTFNPSVAGPGVHTIQAVKNNGFCPDGIRSVDITVLGVVPVVINNPNSTICRSSPPVNLTSNTSGVSWSGPGVSGSSFNPATAGIGTHQVIATKTNGTCPDSKDTLNITVEDFVQAVISNADQTVCRLSSPINLQANTNVTWNGNGVSGNTFNPATAGVGTHQIIATKTNGTCPDSKDTMNITVDDFIQAVISNADQTVCRLSSLISLQANTNVAWSGNGVSGNIFNPATAGVGTHQVIATKANGTCPDSKDTLNITVDDFMQAVISNADQIICKLSSPVSLQANTNVSWSGNGVSGSTFNPATAGVGTHQVIATKTNGTCTDSKDTLNITVDDFVQAVISNAGQTVCRLSSSINLQANTNVTWSGNGVSGNIFNPATAGVGTHQVIATKANGTCPDSKDTLNITVDDFIQAIISNPDQTICRLSSPINLQANTNVTWSGNGVSGNIFNPATAGVGTHRIIATKTNGACTDSKDTLNITVEDFIRPVIGNNDTAVCILNGAFSLRSDIPVTWSGNGVSGNTFNPATAGAGTQLVIATRTNGTCPDGKDTLTVIVQPALLPDVNIAASQSTISNATQSSLLTASNIVAGGTSPLYTFAKDRNFTQILRAESAINTFTVTAQMLNMGANTLYVRMKSNANCVSSLTALDSITLALSISTPPKHELEKALKVFPNPSDGLFSFRFETGINDNVSVTVYDAAGKQVYTEGYGLVGQYYFSRNINLRNRHRGTYSILFRIGNITITRRVNIAS